MASFVVIDSEERVRFVITAMLHRGGHSVRTSGKFEEALAFIRASMPDLVLSDFVLRGITGHDAMLKLRNEFPELPVLMLCGVPDEQVIRMWTGKSGFAVFPKPFTCDSLLEKVGRMIA
jgi:DNA-binding NtrC family response regulator